MRKMFSDCGGKDMSGLKNRVQIWKKIPLQTAGILLLILLSLALLWFNNANSNQASSAMAAQVYFDGEYCIGDGPWQKIVRGEHISSTKGDVTLRGNFHLLDPEGGYVGILVFINHYNFKTIMHL